MNTLLPNGQMLTPCGYNMGYSPSVTPLIHNTLQPLQPMILPSHQQYGFYNDYRDINTWKGGWEEPKIDYWKYKPYTPSYFFDK